MKYFIAVFSLLVCMSCAQTDHAIIDHTITFKQMDWTIRLPTDYKIIDSSTTAEVLVKGKKIVEDETKVKIDSFDSRNLITAEKDKQTILTASYSISPAITLENWQQRDSGDNALILETLIRKVPAKVDTSTSLTSIDGIEFKKMQVSFALSDTMSQHAIHLSTFYRGHMLMIVYTYINTESKNEMEKMLEESKFGR
jgi:hypothetical protein